MLSKCLFSHMTPLCCHVLALYNSANGPQVKKGAKKVFQYRWGHHRVCSGYYSSKQAKVNIFFENIGPISHIFKKRGAPFSWNFFFEGRQFSSGMPYLELSTKKNYEKKKKSRLFPQPIKRSPCNGSDRKARDG